MTTALTELQTVGVVICGIGVFLLAVIAVGVWR